jgi:hypothetical protein
MNQQTTAVCTVFEGHYHKGVAALVNSLYAQGFEGNIWIGYKGDLPPWAIIEQQNQTENALAKSESGILPTSQIPNPTYTEGVGERMKVRDNLTLHFMKLPTEVFLPYYKPDFMLDILNKYQPDAQRIIYLDCDIIVKAAFAYFEEWTDYGVALCEDVNSPISTSDPLRFQWEHYFKQYNMTVRRDNAQYVNGGFIGLHRRSKSFLETWRDVQNLILEDMNRRKADVRLSHKSDKESGLKDRGYMFYRTDQDALNVAKDVTSETVSIVDSSGMDFQGIGFIMSHAASKIKPWEKNWLKFVLKNGQRPSPTDRIFLDYVTTPLSIYSKNELKFKKYHLKLASALARFFA